MRTCAKSYPPSRTPKAPKNSLTPGIPQKTSFCQRTQAAQHQKNTDAFPGSLGLLKPHSRVPALHPNISHPHCTHTLPEIQTHPPGEPRKNIKTRNELNPTQENSWVAGVASNPRPDPAPSSAFIRLTAP